MGWFEKHPKTKAVVMCIITIAISILIISMVRAEEAPVQNDLTRPYTDPQGIQHWHKPSCFDEYSDMRAYMKTQYKEVPIWTGITWYNTMLIMFSKNNSAGFTLVERHTDGKTCMVFLGRQHMQVPVEHIPEGEAL